VVPLAHRTQHFNGISIGSAIFAQLTAERPYTLQSAAFPLKIANSNGDLDLISNTWFLGPI